MKIDTDQLRRHFASLSDEALMAVNREDLVDAAQAIYDEEVAQRERTRPALSDEEREDEENYDTPDDGGRPEWLADAAQIFTQSDLPGRQSAQEAENVRDVLEAAGIPCFLEISEVHEDVSPPTHWKEWRVFVPGKLNQRAASIIERDIGNPTFEEQWKAHLEELSDRDLRAMDPESVFCGLFDRVERITRVYNDELVRRRLK